MGSDHRSATGPPSRPIRLGKWLRLVLPTPLVTRRSLPISVVTSSRSDEPSWRPGPGKRWLPPHSNGGGGQRSNRTERVSFPLIRTTRFTYCFTLVTLPSTVSSTTLSPLGRFFLYRHSA